MATHSSSQLEIGFGVAGYFNVKVSVNNACGTTSKTVGVQVTGFTPPTGSCQYCPAPHLPPCPYCPGIRLPDLQSIVYPNPTNEELTIEFDDVQSGVHSYSTSIQTCDIKLFDKDGREVKRSSWKSNQSSKKVHLDTRNLKKGTYFLHLESNGQVKKEQIIIEK
jgi:hypothetical protein